MYTVRTMTESEQALLREICDLALIDTTDGLALRWTTPGEYGQIVDLDDEDVFGDPVAIREFFRHDDGSWGVT